MQNLLQKKSDDSLDKEKVSWALRSGWKYNAHICISFPYEFLLFWEKRDFRLSQIPEKN